MNRGTVFLAFVTVVSGTLLWHGVDAAHSQSNASFEEQLQVLGGVLELIGSDYVDQPNGEKLTEAAINGMLTLLDRNSSYIDAKTFREMQVRKQGRFGGLGIEGIMENGIVKVIAPMDDTPAAQAGIKANDLITKIDGENVQGLTIFEVADRMRGSINTPITLTILRQGREPIDLKLIRDEIRVLSVKWNVEGKDNDIGYIRISAFTDETQHGLDDAISSLKKQVGDKLKGYIIDLRNNPGGLLDQAVSVSDAFLNHGELVSTRGRLADHTRRFDASEGDLSGGKPLVVLINGGSASGSEVVAGALQDNKRALVIGTRSFGKGSVQRIFPLGKLGALKLTTARFYTPTGRSIDENGIDPDTVIEQEVSPEPGKDISTPAASSLKSDLRNEPQGNHGDASLDYIAEVEGEDLQLKAAIDVLHGLKVTSDIKPKETTPTKGAGAAEPANAAN